MNNIDSLYELPWKKDEYEKQSWGHSLHRIGPYVGRIKPSFAHFLVKYLSKPNETILDPFCGIGTIPLEAALQGRNSIGFDINPYAIAIAKAKTQIDLDPQRLEKIIRKIDINTESVNLNNFPSWVLDFYNQKTFKEILFLLDYFKRNNHYYLYGCLLAISQGHRPGHLSKPSAWTLPYKPKDDDPGEYRDTKKRLIEKVRRNLKDGSLNENLMKIIKKDIRNLNIEPNSIDTIITSPPYFNTLDYINSHRLRLAVMGVYKDKDKKKLSEKTIQNKNSYLEEMEKIIKDLKIVLKPNGICCFVLGDLKNSKEDINTSKLINRIFENNSFEYITTINDTIPINKSIQKRSGTPKVERILIVKNG